MEMTEKTKEMICAELDSLKSKVQSGRIARFSYNTDRMLTADTTAMTSVVFTYVEQPEIHVGNGAIHFVSVDDDGNVTTKIINTKREFVNAKFEECLESFVEDSKDFKASIPLKMVPLYPDISDPKDYVESPLFPKP
jgi:hypothetical protein